MAILREPFRQIRPDEPRPPVTSTRTLTSSKPDPEATKWPACRSERRRFWTFRRSNEHNGPATRFLDLT
jgi:hypothetical protein